MNAHFKIALTMNSYSIHGTKKNDKNKKLLKRSKIGLRKKKC